MSVSFNGSEQQQGSFFTPLLATAATAGIGAGAGALIKEKITAPKLAQMRQDTFEKMVDASPKKETFGEIRGELNKLSPEELTTSAKRITNQAESISVGDLFNWAFPKTGFTRDSFKEHVQQLQESTKQFETTLKEAEEAFKTATNKEEAQQVVNEAKIALEQHLEKIKAYKCFQSVIDTADKDGKIGLDALKGFVKKGIHCNIEDLIKSMGADAPKIFSGKNTLIGAAAGAVIGALGYLMFGRNKN